MTKAHHALSSGKSHRDENFPVASMLIRPRYRPVILAFYRFARAADDVADHSSAPAEDKLRILDDFEECLLGGNEAVAEAVALRKMLRSRALSARHGLDLLQAFRLDVTKRRYADWNDLMEYCRYSAMPVGRFVLDVHGEDEKLWPYSDALCSALQVINHLQDCGKDFRNLDRVYLPLDVLQSAGVTPVSLADDRASPALQRVIAALAARTAALLESAKPFAGSVADFRLGLEVAVIHRLADDLNKGLLRKDPLSQHVHHGKFRMLSLALAAAAHFVLLVRTKPSRHPLLAP